MGIGFMKRSVMPYAMVTVTAQPGGSASRGGQVYKREISHACCHSPGALQIFRLL